MFNTTVTQNPATTYLVVLATHEQHHSLSIPADTQVLRIPYQEEVNRDLLELDLIGWIDSGYYLQHFEPLGEPAPTTTENLTRSDSQNTPTPTLEVASEEIIESAQNLIYDLSPSEDIEVDEEGIASLILHCLESATEDILNYPTKYLDSAQLDRCFHLSYPSYLKLMEVDIPLPHTL